MTVPGVLRFNGISFLLLLLLLLLQPLRRVIYIQCKLCTSHVCTSLSALHFFSFSERAHIYYNIIYILCRAPVSSLSGVFFPPVFYYYYYYSLRVNRRRPMHIRCIISRSGRFTNYKVYNILVI